VSAVRRRSAEAEHSGRLLLRMPRSLHGELAEAAEREGVSLNRLIVARLSGSLTSASNGAEPATLDGAPTRAQAARRNRLLTYALAVNLVVVLAAGAIAVVLLAFAWGS
jgi:hypothetical protein